MTAKKNQDFVTYVGDDVYPIFTVEDSSGVAIDISSVTEITWFAQQSETDSVAVTRKKTLGQITFVTNGVDGKFQVTIPASVTSTLKGYYQHFATITDGGGLVTTIEVGRMQVGPRPGWSYDAAKIATVPRYQVRRLIGDVIANDQQITDAEIDWALTQRSSVYGAAADCCRYIAGQYSRKVDVTSPGEIRTAYGSQAGKYAALAKQLDEQSRARGTGIMPYAGGISQTDKQIYEEDTDRVTPQFNLGMTDNQIPVAPPGNETPNNPQSNPGSGM